jgi:hypothetical protein
MTTSSFIYSFTEKIQSCIQDAIKEVVSAQLASKIGLDVDYQEVLKRIYKSLANAQNTLVELQNYLYEQIENEEKQLEEFIEIVEDTNIDLDFYYMELEENVFDPGDKYD